MAPAASAKSAEKENDQTGPTALFFAMAEAMENGGGRGLISAPTEPPQPMTPAEDRRLTILSDKDETWTKLLNAAGETLLFAKPVEEGNRFNIYVSRTGKKPLAPKPLFSRSFSLKATGRDRKEWLLSCLFCQRCEARGRRACGVAPIARMRLHAEPGGAGAARSIDLELPAPLADGTRACMCSVCGDASAQFVVELTSQASSKAAKGYQLDRVAGRDGAGMRVDKVDSAKATLEYDAPLGMLQAFAAHIVRSQ